MNSSKNKSIILFDGVCNLCNASVNFIIKHDKNFQFIFASLQSDAARELLLQHSLKKIQLDSILLIENNIIYDKSTAVLKIARKLNSGYPLFYAFIIIPKLLRDWAYSYIAKNRYKWFGRTNNCMVPTLEVKNRFIE